MTSPTPLATGRGRIAYPLLAALLVYMVLLGGSALGDGIALLRLANALIGGGFIVAALALSGDSFDRTDRIVVLALIPFSLAGVLSAFPRQSLDAVVAATALAAAFLVARRILQSMDARRLLVMTLQCLSVGVTLVTFMRWVLPTLAWWADTGWTVVPPLTFELPGFPWGHRHDLALLVLMLYPAWWVGRPSLPRRAIALGMGTLVVPIVLLDGSRAVWVAIAVSTLVVGARSIPDLSWVRARWPVVVTLLIGLAVVTVVTGLGSTLLSRAMNPASFGYRTAMWGTLLADWPSHLIAGHGPGSFPWILQLTGYFDTNSLAPRHPDNAVMQMIGEGGILGLASMALVIAAVTPRLLRTGSRASCWALTAFAVAALGGNPTDFTFVLVVALVWTAYAMPRDPVSYPGRLLPPRPVQAISLIGIAAIALAHLAIAIGSFAYESARDAVGRGDLPKAVAMLDAAVAFDPGMALYVRQRGAANYLLEHDRSSVADLEAAAGLNQADDLTWRTLALARQAAGDASGAATALSQAISLQRSDPTNLLLSTAMEGQPAGAGAEALAEVTQAWPEIVFAPGWKAVVPHGSTTESIIVAALERWQAKASMPEVPSDQFLWLAVLAGRTDLIAPAIDATGWGDTLGSALAAAIQCQATSELLDAADVSDKRIYLYWWLRFREAELSGADGSSARLMTNRMRRPIPEEAELLNPLNENHRDSGDAWGYRRWPIDWPQSAPELPSPTSGLASWMTGDACRP